MRPPPVAAEIRAELEHHIEMRAQDNLRAGMDRRAAWEDARRRFGDVGAVAARCQKARGRDDVRNRLHFGGLTGLLVLVLAMVEAMRVPPPSGAPDAVVLMRLVSPTLLTLAVTVIGCCLNFSRLRRVR
jgi:hypothetical protein